MAKPHSQSEIKFPFIFEKNGRTGRIKKWAGKFGVYFMYAGRKVRTSKATFNGAYEYLDAEFTNNDAANSEALHPLPQTRQTYSELEQLLKEKGNGATVRDAVHYFLDNHPFKTFSPLSVSKCIEEFLKEEKANNNSPLYNETLKRHLGHFQREFGARKIHELQAVEISKWLSALKGPKGWSPKTRKNVRGSLVSMSLHAKKILKAFAQRQLK